MSAELTVVVNGSPRGLDAGASVADLVAALTAGEAARGIAVAVNGDVVPRAEWAAARLGDGDRVEVLTAVQGG